MKNIWKYLLGGVLIVGAVLIMKSSVEGFDKNYEPKGYEVSVKDNEKDKNEDNKEEQNEKQDMEEKAEENQTHEKDTEGEEEYNQNVNFTLNNLNGEEVSLSDFKGKKIFLNFWATWCSNCRVEMPHMQELWEKYGEEAVVVAVNVGEPKSQVKEFIDKNEYTFETLLDENSEIADKYGVTGFPTSILIDEKGDIIYGVVGSMSYENMEKFIKGELK